MIYCINPNCLERPNPDQCEFCQGCGCDLIINERYRIVKPLRKLDLHHYIEVFEVDNLGTTKVLKVLTSQRRRLVDLFHQEAHILEKLGHLNVPAMENHFTYFPPGSDQKLHCLVMEKVPGDDLEKWLEKNGVLSETLAINWLSQLSELLRQIHQEKILHRDIKPSNIMLRSDGKLVLIDFGTARQISSTYVEKVANADLTRVYTSGYTAPEQIRGQAVYKSDFFALGCTFVHLLTGVHPENLAKNPDNAHLIWRAKAPHISQELGNLIDSLIAPSPEKRLLNPKSVLDTLNPNRELTADEFPSGGKQSLYIRTRNLAVREISCIWLSFWKVVGISLTVAVAIFSIRYLGLLQGLELKAFDRLIVARPVETKPSRLLLVTIDEADIAYQNQMGMSIRWSLADEALLKLLQKLEPYQPRTIGIDIYRDFAVDPNYPELVDYLSNDSRLYSPCKVPAPEDGAPNGIAPPPEVPPSRLGFSDLIADNDDIVRRQLLYLNPPITSICNAETALNLKIALNFLAKQGIELSITPSKQIQIGEVKFKPLKNHSSGYQTLDASGYQILFNHLAVSSPLDIAEKISLTDVLEDRITPDIIETIKDRIVLIGVTDPSTIDSWKTPYSEISSSDLQHIPGIYVHAQAISQLISAVLDDRSSIWWWSPRVEALWILFWAFLGGSLAWLIHSVWHLGIAISGANCLLVGICFGILLKAGWVPLIPPALALIITPLLVVRLVRECQ